MQAGQLEDEQASPAAEDDPPVLHGSHLKDKLLPNVGDRTWYLTMNMTQPPFDDIHVRKAMNLITDKSRCARRGAAR